MCRRTTSCWQKPALCMAQCACGSDVFLAEEPKPSLHLVICDIKASKCLLLQQGAQLNLASVKLWPQVGLDSQAQTIVLSWSFVPSLARSSNNSREKQENELLCSIVSFWDRAVAAIHGHVRVAPALSRRLQGASAIAAVAAEHDGVRQRAQDPAAGAGLQGDGGCQQSVQGHQAPGLQGEVPGALLLSSRLHLRLSHRNHRLLGQVSRTRHSAQVTSCS